MPDYAALDDGEAMALAIARTRGWQLATDDRKAIRLAGEAAVPVLTTPGVMKRWADQLGPSTAEVSSALIAVRERARFSPSGRDPLCEWWTERMIA
jgi:predicted nucleic acid-binding protein